MEFTDEILIPAPRERVYAALNDPEVLRASIPGCEELIRHSATNYEARVVLKIGPVKARFTGKVTLDPAGAPESFSLTGEGAGGVAGFAKGGALVRLDERPEGTLLTYTAQADVGGKLAQLGNRLIAGTVKSLAAKFFAAFSDAVAPTAGQAGPDETAES